MSITEMKLKALEDLSKLNKQDEIEEVYNFLKKFESKSPSSKSVLQHAKDIINERSEVLHKLAQ